MKDGLINFKVISFAQREVQRLEIMSVAPLRYQLPCHLNKFPWGCGGGVTKTGVEKQRETNSLGILPESDRTRE